MSFQLVFKTDYGLGILNVLWYPQFWCQKRKSSTPVVFSFRFLRTE